jgi:ankyrin repeat protein
MYICRYIYIYIYYIYTSLTLTFTHTHIEIYVCVYIGVHLASHTRAQAPPLLSASLHGSAAMVKLLLSRGADFSVVDEDGATALMLASGNRAHAASIFPLLLAAGVDSAAVDNNSCTAAFYVDERLQNACFEGTLGDVLALLACGGNVNYFNKQSFSALMFACQRYDDYAVAATIVRELLFRGADVAILNAGCVMALHQAAEFSSFEVVTMLLEARSPIDPQTADAITPLCYCCLRYDDEALRIAKALLDGGAQLEKVPPVPLLTASENGSAAMVELLLLHRCKVVVVDSNGATALMRASLNRVHGPAIIPLLVRAGVNVNALDLAGRSALTYGLSGNAAVMRVLVPLYPASNASVHALTLGDGPDPIGCYVEAARYGITIPTHMFLLSATSTSPCSVPFLWAMLRLGGSTTFNTFSAMETCVDAALWRWVGRELQSTQHPENGNTLLHMSALTNNAVAVRELLSLGINPLLRNRAGLKAVDLTSDASIRAELVRSVANPPRAVEVWWYGPFLIQQVRTFLLVLRRWRNTSRLMLPKDVVHMIIAHIRALEHC